MLALVVHFTLRNGRAEAFDEITDATIPRIRSEEPGTLIYTCHSPEADSLTRVFYEVYADRAAFDAHEAQEHIRRFHESWEDLLEGPPRVEFLDVRGGKGLPTSHEA